MGLIRSLNKWANANTNLSIDLLRIFLGLFLFLKGVQFSSHTQILVDLIQPDNPSSATMFLVHYVAMSHIAGGLLVAVGLITRLALLIQLPILIGAVAINFTGELIEWNLLQAMFGLAGASFFIIFGSGKHSVDYNLKVHA